MRSKLLRVAPEISDERIKSSSSSEAAMLIEGQRGLNKSKTIQKEMWG
jgi:hypothetical protein